jgi:hypothetical protein
VCSWPTSRNASQTCSGVASIVTSLRIDAIEVLLVSL